MSSAPPSRSPRIVSGVFFAMFFGLMLFESVRLFWPFMGAIGSAIVLAVVFNPWHAALSRKLPKLSPTFLAILMDLAVAIVFIIPIIFLIWSAVSEAQDLYPILAEKLTRAGGWLHQSPLQTFPILQKLPPSITEKLSFQSAQMQSRLTEAGQHTFAFLAGASSVAAKQLADMLLDFAILIFCLFFMFRDGKQIYADGLALVPLSSLSKRRLSRTMKQTIVGVVRGNLLMSLAQTVIMAIGLLIVHSQAIVLLCFLTFASTFIPTVGTALISVPAALYFFFAVAHWKGIFLFIWGTLGMGSLDNILRPFLVGSDEEMSFLWLFFAILGGLETFGIKGLLLGPLILALMPVLFSIYRDRYLEIPEDETRSSAGLDADAH